ncbi:MAG: iron chelate uptake ABC transporter family permease subunit [Ilumatobacteraceae bacterium]
MTAARRAGYAGPALLWLGGLIVLAASITVTITIGPAHLSPADVWTVIRAKLTGGTSGLTQIQDAIVWQFRLPRVLLAALCGAGLAVSGAILQSLLRNPLADPYMLGISSGAGLGAVGVVVLGLGGGVVGLGGGAFVGALATFVLVLTLARFAGRSVAVLILAGVAIAQLCSALTSFVIFASADAQQTRSVLFWLMGSLATSRWSDVAITAVVVSIGLTICILTASMLDAFTFGEDAAASLGINVGRTRSMLLVVTTLITAVLVSRSGSIGFVGLTLPHAARAIVGVKHRVLIPTSALLGAIFLVWVDTIARAAFAPQEAPRGRDDGADRRARVRLHPRASGPTARAIGAGRQPMRLRAESVSWSASYTLILDHVDVDAAPGTTVGLLGPNGSGKSSLMRVLAGLRAPSSGDVSLDEERLVDLPRRTVARRMALVEQDVATDQDPLVRDVIDLGRIPHRRPWAAESGVDREMVEQAAATTHVDNLLDRRYATLSGGERQRVQLARALAQEPAVLLLDEPTNHLDIRHQLELLALARRTPVTVVMALHDLNLAAAFCDSLIVLNDGRVVATGSPEEVLTPELIESVYGVPARVAHDEDGLHVRFLT